MTSLTPSRRSGSASRLGSSSTSSAPSPSGSRSGSRSRRSSALSVATIAWVLVVVLFVALRVGVVWRAPVGGAELAHLSGAWQASSGIEDARYVPTLYQAVTAVTLGWTDSELPARALALAATLSIPLALYHLRRTLGESGALLALLLLALDPMGIVLGVTATAAAWDTAIAIWLVVALLASRPPPWGWLLLAFLVSTGGPLTLPVVAAAIVVAAIRGDRPNADSFVWSVVGVVLGLLLTSFRFGLGGDGLVVAPFHLFVAGFEEPWSSLTVAGLAALYGLPLLVGGAAAGGWLAFRLRSGSTPLTPTEALLLGTAGAALLWFLVALPSTSPFPLAAATLASCLLLGHALARVASLLLAASWRRESYLLLLAIGLAAVASFVLSDWAREGRVGGAEERMLVALPVIGSLLALALLASYREALHLTFIPALAAGGILLLAGASGVALSAAGEPLPGPVSPPAARAIRDVALDASAARGSVVIHGRYREVLTWPFRNSATLILADRVPPEAAVAVWPLDLPQPEGFVPLEGRWILERSIPGPGGFLQYVRWLGERNSLQPELEIVAIYVRSP